MIMSRLNEVQSQILLRRKRHAYRKKIRSLVNRLSVPLVEVNSRDMGIRKYLPKYNNTDWHVAYASVNGLASSGYLPEEIFYTSIEPKFNDRNFCGFYEDKACLNFLLGSDDHVGNIFFRHDGLYFGATGESVDSDHVKSWMVGQDEVVLKPSRDSGGGRGVVIGPGLIVAKELDKGQQPIVIQKVFRQHQQIARFNPGSVNTIRLMSLRVMGRIKVVSAVMRMGVGGARIDNATRGAVAVGLTDGRMSRYAYDVNFERYSAHPTSGLPFEGEEVPFWERVVELAVRAHNRLLEAGIVSWDITIGEDGRPKVIEANVTEQEINGHQLHNGPVFEPFFDVLFGLQ